MKYFFLFFSLFIVTACTQNDPLLPLNSPHQRDLYKTEQEKILPSLLPDPGFPISLAAQDKSVADILKDISNLADLPLGFDQETSKRAKKTHMNLIAYDAPLDTIVNQCARAINAQITWWPREPLIWIGNTPPPFGHHKKLHIWSLEIFLSEFQVTQPPQLVTYESGQQDLEVSITQLLDSVKKEQENNPDLPELEQYLQESVILKELSRVIGELDKNDEEKNLNSWITTVGINDFSLDSLNQKINNNKTKNITFTAKQELTQFIKNDDVMLDVKNNIGPESLSTWINEFVSFIESYPEVTWLKNSLEQNFWKEYVKENQLTIKTLQAIDPIARVKIYRHLELYKQLKKYQEKRQKRYDQILSHVNKFSHDQETKFKKIKGKISNIDQSDKSQLKRYLKTKQKEAQKIVSLIHNIVGSNVPLSLHSNGSVMMGSITKHQAYVIDIFLNNLKKPEILDINALMEENETRHQRSRQKLDHLVNNAIHATPINTVLYDWARSSQISLSWLSDELPSKGLHLINQDLGSLPLEKSLKQLSKKFNLKSITYEGNNCYWIGDNKEKYFNHPLPSKVRVMTIPSSLQQYSAQYLSDYLDFVLGDPPGFIGAGLRNHLIISLMRHDEQRCLTILAQAALDGALPQRTSVKKKPSR